MELKCKNHKNVSKEFIRYVTLNVLSMLGLSLYIFADTFFVANGIGSDGLAALNLSIPVFSFINGVGLLIGMGAATQYSIYKGKKNIEGGNIVFTNAIKLAGVCGGIITLIGVVFSKDLAILLGADQTVLSLVIPYIKTIAAFAIAFIVNGVLVAFVRNDNNPRLAMIAMITGSISNIILDYIFIFPLKLGMFGAAFATGLAPVFSMIILSYHFLKKKNKFKLKKYKHDFKVIKKIYSTGLPSFINEFSSGIVMLLFNFTILNLAGNIGVAAYGVIANIALIAVSIFTGIAQGVQPLIGRSYGEGNKKDIKKLLKLGICVSSCVGIGLYIVCSIFPNEIIGIFNGEKSMELQSIAYSGIYVYFIAFFFMGINFIAVSFLSSTQKIKQSFIISILRGIVLVVPSIIILPNLFGMMGVWLAVPCAEAITCLITIFILKNK